MLTNLLLSMLILGATTPQTGASYLIITENQLVNALNDFVLWKTQQGFHVTVATTDEIGSDTSEIKAFIDSVRDTISPPLEYVLIVGEEIPTFMRFFDVGVPDMYPIDFLYASTDTVSMQTAFSIGRIPFSDSAAVANILRKIIYYERTPTAHGTRWLSRGLISYSDEMVVATKELTRNWMLANGLHEVDRFGVSSENWPIFDDVLSDSRAFHNHRGYPLWFREQLSFFNYTTPFVSIFITCGSANFLRLHYDGKFLLTSSDTGRTGAATVLGSAVSVYDSSNTILRRRNFADSLINHLIWIDSVVTIGKALEITRRTIAQTFDMSVDTNRLVAYELTILGDPSLNVWRGVPEQIYMFVPDSVPVDSDFTIMAVASDVDDSLIKIVVSQGDSIIAMGTPESGAWSLSLPDTGTYTVTASSPYDVPAQKVIHVVSGASEAHPELYVYSLEITDVPNNGVFTPLDTVRLAFNVANYGNVDAEDLRLHIGSNWPIELFDTVLTLGNLPAGGEIHVDTVIGFVASNSRNGDQFAINLRFTCDGCSPDTFRFYGWVERWFVGGEQLTYREAQQDTNSFIDPGDTIMFFVRFHQVGPLPFGPNGRLLLRTPDPDVQIVDSLIDSVFVPWDGYFNDTTRYFLAVLSPEFNDGDSLHLWLILTDGISADSFDFVFPVGGREYLLLEVSESDHPAAQAIDSLLRLNGFHGFTASIEDERFLNHLADFRTVFLIAYTDHVLSYRQILPHLIDYLNGGGNLWLETNLSTWYLNNELKQRLHVSTTLARINSDQVLGAAGSFAEGFSFTPSMSALAVIDITDSFTTHPLLITPEDSVVAAYYQDSLANAAVFWFSPVDFLQNGDIEEFYISGMGFLLTGVEEKRHNRLLNSLSLNVPSMSRGNILLQIPPHSDPITLRVFDITGRVVMSSSIMPSELPGTRRINIDASGVYFVSFETSGTRDIKKIVVVK